MEVIQKEREHFYKKLFSLATPMFFSHLFGSALAIIDTFMVSSLGDNAVSAVGIGSQIYFFLSMMLFGLFSGFGIFIAQYYGAKEYNNISKVYLTTLFVGVGISLIFLLASQTVAEPIINLFLNQNDSNYIEVLNLAVSYLRIIGFAFIFSTVSFSISMLSRGIQKVLVVNIIQIIGVILNTILNWILINGKLGFEAYGVKGAGYATLISSAFILGSYLVYINRSKEQAFKIKFKYYKDISREFLRKLFKKSIPVFINETGWGLGMTAYLMLYGYLGSNAIATMHLSNQVNGLFWVAGIAIANAASVMIGKKLGENDLETAVIWEKRFRNVGFLVGLFVGVILFIIAPNIANAFTDLSESVRANIILILRIYGAYAPIKFLNAIYIVGPLRAGGDTIFTMLAELIPLWGFGVLSVFLFTRFSNLDLYVIVIIANIEELIKITLLLQRSKTRKWVKNLTLENA